MPRMIDCINKYRHHNGRDAVRSHNLVVSDYCMSHCIAMANCGDIYHTPACYVGDWREAVGMISYNDYWQDQMVFDVFGSSDAHKSVLLDSNEIAYASLTDNWRVYTCIRGR